MRKYYFGILLIVIAFSGCGGKSSPDSQDVSDLSACPVKTSDITNGQDASFSTTIWWCDSDTGVILLSFFENGTGQGSYSDTTWVRNSCDNISITTLSDSQIDLNNLAYDSSTDTLSFDMFSPDPGRQGEAFLDTNASCRKVSHDPANTAREILFGLFREESDFITCYFENNDNICESSANPFTNRVNISLVRNSESDDGHVKVTDRTTSENPVLFEVDALPLTNEEWNIFCPDGLEDCPYSDATIDIITAFETSKSDWNCRIVVTVISTMRVVCANGNSQCNLCYNGSY